MVGESSVAAEIWRPCYTLSLVQHVWIHGTSQQIRVVAETAPTCRLA